MLYFSIVNQITLMNLENCSPTELVQLPKMSNSVNIFFQKIKRRDVLKGVLNKKRSEISTVLVQESAKLEQEEGRQQVKVQHQMHGFHENSSSQQSTIGW